MGDESQRGKAEEWIQKAAKELIKGWEEAGVGRPGSGVDDEGIQEGGEGGERTGRAVAMEQDGAFEEDDNMRENGWDREASNAGDWEAMLDTPLEQRQDRWLNNEGRKLKLEGWIKYNADPEVLKDIKDGCRFVFSQEPQSNLDEMVKLPVQLRNMPSVHIKEGIAIKDIDRLIEGGHVGGFY